MEQLNTEEFEEEEKGSFWEQLKIGFSQPLFAISFSVGVLFLFALSLTFLYPNNNEVTNIEVEFYAINKLDQGGDVDNPISEGSDGISPSLSVSVSPPFEISTTPPTGEPEDITTIITLQSNSCDTDQLILDLNNILKENEDYLVFSELNDKTNTITIRTYPATIGKVRNALFDSGIANEQIDYAEKELETNEKNYPTLLIKISCDS